MSDEHSRRLALWRYEIIAPLLALVDTTRGSLKAALHRLGGRTYSHPDRGPIHFSEGTLEHWLYDYKRYGLESLEPATRKDRGKSRRLDDALAEAIESLASERPELHGRALLAELRAADPQRSIPSLSTLYRFLRARGLDQRRAPARRDHRAFAFDLAGDCWQGDIMFGPSLPTANGRRAGPRQRSVRLAYGFRGPLDRNSSRRQPGRSTSAVATGRRRKHR